MRYLKNKKTDLKLANALTIESEIPQGIFKLVLYGNCYGENLKQLFIASLKLIASRVENSHGKILDEVYDYLRLQGIKNFLLDGPGGIRVHSDSTFEHHWKIGVQNPCVEGEDKSMGLVQLKNGALKTLKGKKDTSKPSAVTVMARTACEAENYANSLLSMDSERALMFMNLKKLHAFLVTSEGRVFTSAPLMDGHRTYA